MSDLLALDGLPIYIDVDGEEQFIGILDSHCHYSTVWRFLSERTRKSYVLGAKMTLSEATSLAISIDKLIVAGGH